MRRFDFRLALLSGTMLALFSLSPAWAHDGGHAQGAAEFGKVSFPIACNEAAQARFERGLAMLHSFFYPETVRTFEAAIAADPACAMAWWGLAMSQRINPLVPPWPPENLRRAAEAIERGQALARDERERDWLGAAEAAFKEHATVPTAERSQRYEQAMERLATKYPDDREAQIFYALALLEAVDLHDKTYARQIKAGAILDRIFQQQPEHPGLAHYIVHTYDFEPLAERGLGAADRYAAIAPLAPHAQHMPSHIYSMLGRWEASIRSNQMAVRASREYAAENAPGTTFSQEPHAQDFMAYAYLQLGQDREARRVVEELAAIRSFSGGRNYGRDNGTVAPAVRYVLEHQAWEEALALPVRTDLYAYAQAMPRFARAVGAARLRRLDMAEAEIGQLGALAATAEDGFWRGQIDILRTAAGAWLSRAQGRDDVALDMMCEAARLEDGSEKHVAMENRLYPMREMLGDLLLDLNRPAEALQAYEAALHATPNRLHGFFGAAKAAQVAGDAAKAGQYFERLTALGRNADPDRREVIEARAYLSDAPSSR
jgi:tetratricopeptide (TPR) repeat protein